MTKKEMNRLLIEAKVIIARKNEEIERLTRIIRGERVCDDYCSNCMHHISMVQDPFRFKFSCDLDCKCKSFVHK